MQIDLLSAFFIGIAGSIHCLAMCGGIATALSFACPKDTPAFPFLLAYNLGRISSYAMAGALTGGLGAILSSAFPMGPLTLNLISILLLMLLGLYLGEWWRILAKLERLGNLLWRPISPIAKRFIPFQSPLSAYCYGLIWGWLPCGLIYSTLSWAMASGSAYLGASVMIMFGLGTLPAMLSLSSGGEKLHTLVSEKSFRQLIGLALISFGGVKLTLLFL